jgi:hypothetical protein
MQPNQSLGPNRWVLMTVIEIRPRRWGWKALEAPGVEQVFQRKIRQSTMLRIAPAFAQERFGFWIQVATSSALFRSTTQIESYDALVESREAARDFAQTDAGCVGCADFSPGCVRDCRSHTGGNINSKALGFQV